MAGLACRCWTPRWRPRPWAAPGRRGRSCGGGLPFQGTPAEPLGGPEMLGRVRDAAWVLLAADTLGACEVMIEKAVDYAKERRQFGRVIGSFQAVKHMCAEMAAELEPCRALVWYAAYAFDEAKDESKA